MLRITSTPVLGWCVLQGHHVAAVSVFVLAGLTDWVDGYIARNVRGQMSTLGSVLDPLADKLLVCVLFLTLTKVGYLPGKSFPACGWLSLTGHPCSCVPYSVVDVCCTG